MSDETFADRLFSTERKLADLECDLFERLVSRFGDDVCDDVTYDYYDRSVELLGCAPGFTLDDAALEYFQSLGFARGWLSHTDETETTFVGMKIREPRKVGYPRTAEKRDRERDALRASVARLRAALEKAARLYWLLNRSSVIDDQMWKDAGCPALPTSLDEIVEYALADAPAAKGAK